MGYTSCPRVCESPSRGFEGSRSRDLESASSAITRLRPLPVPTRSVLPEHLGSRQSWLPHFRLALELVFTCFLPPFIFCMARRAIVRCRIHAFLFWVNSEAPVFFEFRRIRVTTFPSRTLRDLRVHITHTFVFRRLGHRELMNRVCEIAVLDPTSKRLFHLLL